MAKYQATRKLIEAVKLSPLRGYEIARRAGWRAEALTRFLHGYGYELSPDDPRLRALAKVLALKPAQCLERVTVKEQDAVAV